MAYYGCRERSVDACMAAGNVEIRRTLRDIVGDNGKRKSADFLFCFLAVFRFPRFGFSVLRWNSR